MAFPTTSTLDTFTRANEGPPPSANWGSGSTFSGLSVHSVASNACTGGQQSYWSASTFGPDQEAWFTVSTLAGPLVGLHMRVQAPNTGGADAYEIVWRDDGTIEVIRVIDAYTVETTLNTTTTTPVASGHRFGAEVLGAGATVTINVYIDTGSGWTLALTASDTGGTRITGAGNIGIITGSTSDVIDNFGGGTSVAGNPWFAYHQMRQG